MSKKCKAYSASKLDFAPHDNRKSFYAGWDAAIAQHQPRKPLTDEEIAALVLEWWCPTMVTAKDRKFARAIERAHGIGGEG